ncbi:MAG: RdgB/HAM1 family non-canonical purine NTP pyrophosphatase [Burkholderiaceae bacterium]|jgi:XTP/dITP diphosphohydrolase
MPEIEPLQLVLASSNPGKLRELKALFAPLKFAVCGQAELGVGEAEEPFSTFVENALAKARHASRATGRAALADDSGLCVEALGGEPGVHSARYAGEPRSDLRNNECLVAAMQGVANRKAHYYCVLVLLRRADDPQPLIAEGIWRGEIVQSPRGESGFGYDPHFYLPDRGCTAAELSAAEKNRISHRAQALSQLMETLARSSIRGHQAPEKDDTAA